MAYACSQIDESNCLLHLCQCGRILGCYLDYVMFEREVNVFFPSLCKQEGQNLTKLNLAGSWNWISPGPETALCCRELWMSLLLPFNPLASDQRICICSHLLSTIFVLFTLSPPVSKLLASVIQQKWRSPLIIHLTEISTKCRVPDHSYLLLLLFCFCISTPYPILKPFQNFCENYFIVFVTVSCVWSKYDKKTLSVWINLENTYEQVFLAGSSKPTCTFYSGICSGVGELDQEVHNM